MCKVCEKYPYSSGRTGGNFSVKPCMNTDQTSHAFRLRENSKRHQRLETEASRASVLDKLTTGVQKKSFNAFHTNSLYLRKYIHTLFFMIKKHMALTDYYGDTIKFIAKKLEKPITSQYLQTCPRNAKYVSKKSAESMLGAMNSYYELHQLKEIREAPFFSLTAEEAENSSHKCFSVFITYYSLPECRIVNTLLGVVNLKGKTASRTVGVITNNGRN